LAAHIHRKRDHLGVCQRSRFTNEVAVELEVLAEAATLLLLVAEELRHAEPADRLAHRRCMRRNHPCESRRHLRTQRYVTTALVDELEQLGHDLVAALGGV